MFRFFSPKKSSKIFEERKQLTDRPQPAVQQLYSSSVDQIQPKKRHIYQSNQRQNVDCLKKYKFDCLSCVIVVMWVVVRAVMCLSLEWEVSASYLGPVKSDTVLKTARHHCNISRKKAVLFGCNDVQMSSANLLHASV